MSWEGFKYIEIPAVARWIAIRRARTERRNMLRFFHMRSDPSTKLGRVCINLAKRLQALHNDSRLNAETKRAHFNTILNHYSNAVMEDSNAFTQIRDGGKKTESSIEAEDN